MCTQMYMQYFFKAKPTVVDTGRKGRSEAPVQWGMTQAYGNKQLLWVRCFPEDSVVPNMQRRKLRLRKVTCPKSHCYYVMEPGFKTRSHHSKAPVLPSPIPQTGGNVDTTEREEGYFSWHPGKEERLGRRVC